MFNTILKNAFQLLLINMFIALFRKNVEKPSGWKPEPTPYTLVRRPGMVKVKTDDVKVIVRARRRFLHVTISLKVNSTEIGGEVGMSCPEKYFNSIIRIKM